MPPLDIIQTQKNPARDIIRRIWLKPFIVYFPIYFTTVNLFVLTYVRTALYGLHVEKSKR